MTSVIVIGAGMAGARCAQVLAEHRVPVRLYERGRAAGGRMFAPLIDGRRVDLGASYFTVGGGPDSAPFADAVAGWHDRGLVRPWTDRFDVASNAGFLEPSVGPLRWAAPGGLSSVVQSMCEQLTIETEHEVGSVSHDGETVLVDGDAATAVVLAMPDPQARRLVSEQGSITDVRGELAVDYEPVIAVSAAWPERQWPFRDGVFVNDHPAVTFVADDGSRRGDGAPVLVAHTTASCARQHAQNADDAIAAVLDCYREQFGLTVRPDWVQAHRWRTAKPSGAHENRFGWYDWGIGIASDAWCVDGAPRVESAWSSGNAVAARVLEWIQR